jgi:two-component system sensor histidine kinase VanS
LSKQKEKKHGYRALERKLFLKIISILTSALVAVLLFQSLARGRAGTWIVMVLQNVFGMPLQAALGFHQQVIRNNAEVLLLGTGIVFFLILSRFFLSQFSAYFTEVSSGLDILVGNTSGEIKLSPEMSAMESKLRTIQHTLAEREREARTAEQRKNDLVMYLAHDIKTPLTSVIGYLSLLHEAPDMPATQKAKYVDITLDKAYRLEKLVGEFFEITRYSFQAELLSKEGIDLYTMLAQMTDEFYPLLAAKGKQAILHVPEDITIYGDAEKLARVFNNVLKNAIAYSPDDSVIDISAAAGSTISIVFTNDGAIPKEKLSTVFDKFYRLDAARSSDTGGAGLGLAIAKEIVISHGGTIYAASDGARTSFTIELPTMPEANKD